jgi:Spy/CpxP family protein refolding chaperone
MVLDLIRTTLADRQKQIEAVLNHAQRLRFAAIKSRANSRPGSRSRDDRHLKIYLESLSVTNEQRLKIYSIIEEANEEMKAILARYPLE